MTQQMSHFPEGQQFKQQITKRHQWGKIWSNFFLVANIITLIALIVLSGHIINQSFGLVVIRNTVEPSSLSDRPLVELSEAELANLLLENSVNLRVVIRDSLSQVPNAEYTTSPLSRVLAGSDYPQGRDDATINDLSTEELLSILTNNLSQSEMYDVIATNVVRPVIIASWSLIPSLFNRSSIEKEASEKYPQDTLEFRSWVNPDFVSSSSSSSATTTGLLTALLGSFWIIGITAIVALPLGVGAAIYLEEYAKDNFINRIIEVNIRNLAAIPSVIYGMLGLAVFVRALGNITSGSVFGITDSNGRTVLSAGLTLALLILPVLIINAQEAIKAVPSSFREASYGLGATKWQTVRKQVLPAALPGIMTGVILSMSRAVGETAPLLVVGASTFIGINPNGPFSKFTVVPIQIYQWTSRPESEFKNVAAAAIIVLLILMVTLNGTAIIIRNRFSRRY